MEKDAKYLAVGIFATAVVVALIGFVVWLMGASRDGDYTRYTVYFHGSVSGLSEGARVQFKGVDVGQVVDLRLPPQQANLVKADIDVLSTVPVRSRTRASMEVQGITGLVHLELKTSPHDEAPAQELPGERYPVIQGESARLSQILEDIANLSKQLSRMSEKMNDVLDDGSIRALRNSIGNMERLSRDFNGLLTPQNVENASRTLDAMAQSADGVQDMVDRLNQTADQIESAASAMNRVVTRNEKSINRFASEGVDEIITATKETKETAASFRKLADELRKDPSQILHRPAPSGVEIPK